MDSRLLQYYTLDGEAQRQSFDFDPYRGVVLEEGKIAQITEQSLGKVGAQPIASARPELVANALNGWPVARFSGAQFLSFGAQAYNFVTGTSGYIGNSRTVYLVMKNNSSQGSFLAKSYYGNKVNRYALFMDSGLCALYQPGSVQYNLTHTGSTAAWQVYVHQLDLVALKARLYVGATLLEERDIASTSFGESPYRLLVGAYNYNANGVDDSGQIWYANADIARIFGEDGQPHSQEQITAKVNEFKTRYGL